MDSAVLVPKHGDIAKSVFHTISLEHHSNEMLDITAQWFTAYVLVCCSGSGVDLGDSVVTAGCHTISLPPVPVCPNTITLYRYLRETYTEVQTETVLQSCRATASLVLPPGQGVAVEGASQITLGVGTAMLAAGVIIITGSIVVVLFGIVVWSRRKKK